MWTTPSLWFEVALVSILFALGHILLGHFEERTPRSRKLLKFLFTLVLITGVSLMAGRSVAMILLGLLLLPVLYIHAWVLPRHGINGWTGEPRERYYAFRGWTLTDGDRESGPTA